MQKKRSEELFIQASQLLPGAVNSPVRAFRAVGGNPVFIEHGRAGHIFDVDGNEYIDFVGSWGPLILGHAHPAILQTIQEAANRGTTYGAPTEVEIRLAEKIHEAIPSIEMLRLVSSGTEATMSALRVARGFTGKKNIIKFEGCYHGHHDSLLTSAGSGVATFDLPDSAGVPDNYSRHTISVAYNDIQALESLPKETLADTAAVILEPVAANMGLVQPESAFLQALRDFTRDRGILLIFDEVITGFRVAYGGAQAFYNIRPDLTCLGKIVGGGLPLAAYGGKAEIMEKVAPLGPVYQAGTLSGNPVAASAGLATLQILQKENPYAGLTERTTVMLEAPRRIIREKDLPICVSSLGSMFTFFFTQNLPLNFQQAKRADTSRYAAFFWQLMENGIYTACSQFETNFVNAAHTPEDLQKASVEFSRALTKIF
jgi:glutamate-1-semialdehyde 2,1-aminomutase